MSGLPQAEQVKNHFTSGEPGTTGREPFDESSASGPGQQFSGTGAGAGAGGLTGQHGSHSHGQHSHSSTGIGSGVGAVGGGQHHHSGGAGGVRDELTAGSGLSYGQKTGTGLTGEGHGLGQGQHTGTGSGGLTGSNASDRHGLGGGNLTGAAGGAAAAVGSGVGGRDHGDRVGNVGQDSSKYEGDLHSAPKTSGAAGTDRFDAQRGSGAAGSRDGQYADGVEHDTSQRAPGKSSGGLSGLLATSDKDFTGRDRKGEGAYADTDGKYELNSTGPAGNTALTGREGNLDNNPVHQAKSRSDGSASTTTTGEPQKEGLVDKVKHAVGL